MISKITITSAAAWPTPATFPGQEPVAGMVIDGALADGDRLEIAFAKTASPARYRLSGRVLMCEDGHGPHFRVAFNVHDQPRLMPVTASERPVVEFLDSRRAQLDAWREEN